MDKKLGTINVVRNLNGTLSGVSNVTGELNGIRNVSGDVGVPREVAIKDHERLTGREKPNQHPIEAITDLDSSLENLETEGIPNSVIEMLLT